MRVNSATAARPRAARRLGLALALTAGTLAATASGALAAPAIRVAPSTSLDPAAANVLAVTGTGFTADAVTQSLGFYAGVTATVDGAIYADMGSAQYLRDGNADGPTRLNTDGTFATSVTANRRFTSGGRDIDCAVTQCVVRTWRAHGNPSDTNLLALRVIVFRAVAPGTPEVTVTPTRDLSRDTPTDVTVSGTGFDPNTAGGIGFYVAYGPKTASYWTQSPQIYGAVKYVRPGATPGPSGDVLNPDGTWRTTLTVSPAYTGADRVDYDCRLIECGILTFAAQGNADRTFDTATTLSFVPLPPKAEVSPTTGLNRDAATTVTVRGSSYAGGTYVGLTATVDGRVLTGDQTTFRWIRAAGAPTPADRLNADGTFETTVTVTPTFVSGTTTVDCRVVQCAISSWRQHTNPTPATLWTTAPLTFAAAVIPPIDPPRPPVNPPSIPPAVVAPKVDKPKTAQKLGKGGIASLGTIVAGSQDATLSAPRSVKLKIGKKSYRVKVLVPKRLAKGKRAQVRVQLSRAAIAALKGRKAKLSVKVGVTAGGKKTTVTASATLKGAKKAAKKAVKKATV